MFTFLIELVGTLFSEMTGRRTKEQKRLALEGAAVVAILATMLVFLAVWMTWTRR